MERIINSDMIVQKTAEELFADRTYSDFRLQGEGALTSDITGFGRFLLCSRRITGTAPERICGQSPGRPRFGCADREFVFAVYGGCEPDPSG